MTQFEYDRIHGPGSFAALRIPSPHERARHPDWYLPATDAHPNAREVLRSIPSAQDPMLTDLGVWNVFFNPDFPRPQLTLYRILCTDPLDDRFSFHA